MTECVEVRSGSCIPRRALLLFCAAAFVFQFAIWNGRIGNVDSYHQLVETVQTIDSGHLGIDDQRFKDVLVAVQASTNAGGPQSALLGAWAQGGDGRWYQVHDPGNKVLMMPAVIVSRLLGQQPSSRLDPSAATKVLVSGSFALLGVFLALFLALGLAIVMPAQRALRWAALGVVATILLPYAKQTWDVFPSAVLIAGVAWVSLRRFTVGNTRLRSTVLLFALASGACWFRFSLTVFVLLGCCTVECLVGCPPRTAARAREIGVRLAVGVSTFGLLLLPVLLVNHRVTGQFWAPPLSKGDVNTLWAVNPLSGIVDQLFSPNRGLVWFSPVLVLVAVALWRWRAAPAPIRKYMLAWLFPIGGYLFAIGSLRNEGGGWGPRYLLPFVPIMWIPVAMVGIRWLDSSRRARVATFALVGLSIVLAALPTLTNWNAVSSQSAGIIDADAMYPRQIVETASFVGREVPDTGDVDDGGTNSHQWPDLATLYATRRAGLPDAVGYASFLALLAVALALFRAADRQAIIRE